MQIHGFPGSRATRAVWAAEEAGVAYEYVYVALTKGEGRGPAYLAINPGGKVPAVVDGAHVITESGAIVLHIGDRAPESGIVPAVGTRERDHVHRWLFFVIGELEQPLWTIVKHTRVLPEARRVPAIVETARWEFKIAVKVLAADLRDREFLVGDRFTVADLFVAHTIAWARAVGAEAIPEGVSAHADRMLARPALARARRRESAAAAS